MAGQRKGKRLERLVAVLERTLAHSGARIEAPSRRLIDRDTGRAREHDVVIIWDHGHHQIITAVECRDRSRPVGVPEVEAFADKCERTGVHSGVIVSAMGFHSSARAKAEARSITCMELSEVEGFDWLGGGVVYRYNRQFDILDVAVMFNGEGPTEISAILNEREQQVSADELSQLVMNTVPQAADPEEEVGRVIPVQLRVFASGWTARDASGRGWPISYFQVVSSCTMQRVASPFVAHRYKGGGKDYAIASADAPIGSMPGRVVLVRNEDDSTSVYWTRDTHEPTAGQITLSAGKD